MVSHQKNNLFCELSHFEGLIRNGQPLHTQPESMGIYLLILNIKCLPIQIMLQNWGQKCMEQVDTVLTQPGSKQNPKICTTAIK